MPSSEELEIMAAINLRDEAYYMEEAAALRAAMAQGRHGGNGPEVEEEEDGEQCE